VSDKPGITAVATGTVEALKSSPALLVLVLLNVFILGLAVYVGDRRQAHVAEQMEILLNRCLPK
jgi:hypothetical protein